MTKTEKAIRDFCGHRADWWPSATQVQAMLALAQPCPTCEALSRAVMLDQTSHDTRREWAGLMLGVRVKGNTVVISVKGGNDNARLLCGELLQEKGK